MQQYNFMLNKITQIIATVILLSQKLLSILLKSSIKIKKSHCRGHLLEVIKLLQPEIKFSIGNSGQEKVNILILKCGLEWRQI